MKTMITVLIDKQNQSISNISDYFLLT